MRWPRCPKQGCRLARIVLHRQEGPWVLYGAWASAEIGSQIQIYDRFTEPWPRSSGSQDHSGGSLGGRMPLAAASRCRSPLAAASVKPDQGCLRAVSGTCWWSMVRRRSTVRFRKGAPRSGRFFETNPATFSSVGNRSAVRLAAGTCQSAGSRWRPVHIGPVRRSLRGAIRGARSSSGWPPWACGAWPPCPSASPGAVFCLDLVRLWRRRVSAVVEVVAGGTGGQ
jgi:hypothetical protein